MAKRSSSSWSGDAAILLLDTSDSEDRDSCYSSEDESFDEFATLSPPPSIDTAWIIEHILESRPSDEQLPLRVMFSFNSGQRLPTLKDAHQWWHFRKDGKKIISFLSSLDKLDSGSCSPTFSGTSDHTSSLAEQYGSLHSPHDRFMDPGNHRLLRVKSQEVGGQARRASQGLPPSFVQKLVLSTIFKAELGDADFKQALAGLDYLRDFEDTRRCSLRESAQRLGIKMHNWRDVLRENVRALEWVEDVLQKETILESYYTRIYVNLRIWTMIQEFKEPAFYKPNVLAMLNTLFPPSIDDNSNMPVKAHVLHRHRAYLYNLMVDVEAQPPLRRLRMLENFIARHLRRGTGHSWPETRMQLEKYMSTAESMIRQARLVQGVEFFNPHASPYVKTSSTFEFRMTPPNANDPMDPFRDPKEGDVRNEQAIPMDPMPKRPDLPRGALLINPPSTQDILLKPKQMPSPIASSNLIPARSPLRLRDQKLNRSPSLLTDKRPRFHARRHSDTTLLPPRRIHEASHPLDSLLTIQTSDLRRMILTAIKVATARSVGLAPTDATKGLSRSGSRFKARTITLDSNASTSGREISSDTLDKVSFLQSSQGLNIHSTDPLGSFVPHHRRVKSRSNATHSRTNSRGVGRPFLRRDNSGLRHVENADFAISPKMPQPASSQVSESSPKSSPPKLRYQRTFQDRMLRKERAAAAEAYVEERFPRFDSHRIPGTPSLQSKASFATLSKPSTPVEGTRSRKMSFASRPSTTISRSRDPVGSPYAQSPTYSVEIFPTFEQKTPTGARSIIERVITPLQGYDMHDSRPRGLSSQKSPSLKKQASFGFFNRPSYSTDGYDRQGRPETPYSPVDSVDSRVPFSRTPPDGRQRSAPKRGPLKKQRSYGYLEGKTSTKISTLISTFEQSNSRASRPSLRPPPSSAPVSPNKSLKRKISLPTMGFLSMRRHTQAPSSDYQYFATNDPKERVIISRPETALGIYRPSHSPQTSLPPSPSNKLRKAQSVTSLHSPSQKSPNASSFTSRGLFRKKSKEVVVTSADIDEPFPPHLSASIMRHSNNSEPHVGRGRKGQAVSLDGNRPSWWVTGHSPRLTERYMPITEESHDEFRRKEYARQWYLEEARARKRDMQSPTGGPLGVVRSNDEQGVGEKTGGGVKTMFRKKAYGNVDAPRTTKKDLKRPERTRLDGIFGLKFGKTKEVPAVKYIPVDANNHEMI